MAKRKSTDPDDNDTSQDMSLEDLDAALGKRVRQTWVMRRISSEDKRLETNSIAMESPGDATPTTSFAIRGEDLDLLGDSLATADIDMTTGVQSDQHEGNNYNRIVTNNEADGSMGAFSDHGCDAYCGRQDEPVSYTIHPGNSDVHIQQGHGMDDIHSDDIVQPVDVHDVSVSDGMQAGDTPIQVSVYAEHQTTSGNLCETNQQEGGMHDDLNQSIANQCEGEVNHDAGSESDCEIIGVVPNRHGVVMNHRVVPRAQRSPIIELYDSLCGLAALTNGFATNGMQNRNVRDDGTQPEVGVNPYASHSSAAGESEYTLFDEHTSDVGSIGTNGVNQIAMEPPCHGNANTTMSNPDVENNDGDDDDIIVGPMFWGPPRPPIGPRDYYAKPKPIVSAYNYVDSDGRSSEAANILDDVEFLFRCPICYSTIARFKSGKIPNNNDRVIYSTKCGHMYCFECIEGVKKRRECSICRKPLRDSKQYHVIYP